YAATQLPCLIHGGWTKCERNLDAAIEGATLALIRWTSSQMPHGSNASWGPLPVRRANGTIQFPLTAVEGWAWKEEFLAARRMRPDVTATYVWRYDTDCMCRPFSFLPTVYRERVRIGKEARGIVLKLGP